MKRIVLASASPRRRELMVQAGFDFEVCVSTVVEKRDDSRPDELVCHLAEQKALDVAKRIEGTGVIIGADTMVVCDDEILGKPVDEADAFRMLQMLQGRTHQVYTGVSMIEALDGSRKVTDFVERTDVTMYPLSDETIWQYIRTGEPMDKAGAYGIQGFAAVFVKSIRGDYNNVVGLPIAAIWQYLNGTKEEGHAAL